MQKSEPPKDRQNGGYDREAIKAMFMASKYLDWTRFAEELGWDALLVRRELPVRTWQKEKRDFIAARHMDILSATIFERKFWWTNEIIKTLDTYPKAIDQALGMLQAKMNQFADMYDDYVNNFRGKHDKMHYKARRIYHPFEKLKGTEVATLAMAFKSVTDAKLKALMLDKWAISRMDLPLDEIPSDPGMEDVNTAHRVTIEGKGEITFEELQGWWDRYHDKPQMVGEASKNPTTGNQTSNEVEKGVDGSSEP